MRKIKFRAWNQAHKIMSQPFTLQDALEHRLSRDADFRSSDLMQFTGLHDKNGKPIYEGDVIRYPNGMNVPVEWRDIGQFSGFNVGNDMPADIQVIGNISDTPEFFGC